ncbi:RluA family pseudouridine synthase [Flavobacterium sp.]|uniref:RluA family pseudouridine synthase n=1 Tax=Flavobacterium sp. TaxID=239 RepID=UPI002489F0AA|nr:RluA family pseudouridine synthase [Flavobacterium sp.]MDI1316624.1 pseudouridine synthase [Flavobacterium sp.]
MPSTLFQPFKTTISEIALPEKFTYPFHYQPHRLSVIACEELQEYLESQTDFIHNFGLDKWVQENAMGKMFGVVVVQNTAGELGYLCAFSGKLADQNHLPNFVPTVFDMLAEDGFFVKGIKELTVINSKVAVVENNPDYNRLKEKIQQETTLILERLALEKSKMSEAKKFRKVQRKNAQLESTDSASLEKLMNELVRESLKDKFLFRELNEYLETNLTEIKEKLNPFSNKINQLKEERKQKSAKLQQQLFSEYAFLNQYQDLKSLEALFNGNPPAGAGECAAPKLLHYAFQHNLKPISMAEFWWGQSPKSEIRTHKQYYPACTGKCEPILKHMLKDIVMDENPFGINLAEEKELEMVFEDEHLAVVNKPAGFLSVPGKQVTDSVYTRMKALFPNASGPLVVHRLDMATSGLLLIAKTSEIHKNLQSQFIKRKIQKRYVALLDGLLTEENGFINLPLRTDFDNRPNQMVCYEYGKPAQTKWKTIELRNNKTLVYFYPVTGRTHQLRVHAAHTLGLNLPIVGDAMYGNRSNRLYLHAESITFNHPISLKNITVKVKANFDW